MSHADVVAFVRGGQVQLPVLDHGSQIDLIAPWGQITIPRTAIRSITPVESVAATWLRRQAAAEARGTSQARFEAAWWALEQGLTPEAIAMFRLARATPADSELAPLTRVIRQLDRLEESARDPDLSAVEAVLGRSGWTRLAGRRVLLLHQSTAFDAAERLEVLDRVVTTYYLSLAAQGIELPVPEQRLISVWFARQADYKAMLPRIDAAPFAETQGYYHPNYGIVFAFDTRSAFDQAGPRRDLDQRRLTPNLTTDQQAEISRQTLFLDLRWRSVDLGIAAHETIHQLVAASRLAPHFDDLPIWLHEGLSAQFEVVRNGRWAGVGKINDHRLPDWRAINPPPRLPPLLSDRGLNHGYHRDRYAEAWALVYFLRKTRPDEFVTFLNLLQSNPTINSEPRFDAAFHSAFGADEEILQTEWRTFIRALRLPIESTDGRPSSRKSL